MIKCLRYRQGGVFHPPPIKLDKGRHPRPAREETLFIGSAIWKGRKHYLDKMTLSELVEAYFCYPAIQTYLFLAIISGGLTIYFAESIPPILFSVIAVIVVYPVVWYLLHRFILHGKFLYKSPLTAPTWKRIHFDHHRDPNDLGVLFGALKSTLPTILIMTLPTGLVWGVAGACAGVTTGLLVTCFYEFCHCCQHLAYTPKWKFLKQMKKQHIAHHFHNEQGNFGITNFMVDRLFGTFYSHPDKVPRTPTVFNLGYTDQEAITYPWVAELSGFEPGSTPIPKENFRD